MSKRWGLLRAGGDLLLAVSDILARRLWELLALNLSGGFCAEGHPHWHYHCSSRDWCFPHCGSEPPLCRVPWLPGGPWVTHRMWSLAALVSSLFLMVLMADGPLPYLLPRGQMAKSVK